jgi:hypothetical protein
MRDCSSSAAAVLLNIEMAENSTTRYRTTSFDCERLFKGVAVLSDAWQLFSQAFTKNQ